MNVKRVLVCSSELLLGAIVIQLLENEIDIDVIGITSIDEIRLAEVIHLTQPDIVVLPLLLVGANVITLTNIITQFPDLNLISVCFDDNRVQAYTKREIELANAADLAMIIRSQLYLI